MTPAIGIYQAIQVIFNILLKYIFGTFPEFKISAVFRLFVLLSPLVYLVYHTLGHGVFSTLVEIEDVPGFQEKLVGYVEVSHWYHGNGFMCVGYHCVEWVWISMYFKLCPDKKWTFFILV